MKTKQFLFFFVLLMVSTSELHAQGQILAPKVHSTIIVDGVVDAAWDNIPWKDMHSKFGDIVTDETEYKVQFKVAWRNNTIYVLGKLTDNVIASHANLASSDGWKRDFLTVYFDFYPWGNYSYSESPHAFYYRTNIGSMLDIRTDGRFRDNLSAPVGVMSSVSLITGGAYVEFSVDATKFWPNALVQNQEFAFNFEGGDCDNLVTPTRIHNWWYTGNGDAWETPAGRLAWAKLDQSISADIAPNAPTNLVATAGNAKSSVAFTSPVSNGGSDVIDYTVTSSPGNLTSIGSSSPIVVTGLTNDVDYTFTVTARNIVGSSASSAPSSTVTPHATNHNIAVSTATNISALTITPVSDIVISSNKLIINAATTVNSITAAPGAQLELTNGNTLTAGTITLQGDATGTATLVDNTTSNPQSITATVQQYVEAGRNWYMSIPLASGASTLLNRGTSVVCYDEPSGTWIAPAANTLNKMRGYVETATTTPLTGSTGTLDFTGVVNTGEQSISLTRTAGKTGFNLVGNPYTSYLDWNAVTKTNVSNTLWYRTKEGGVYKFYTFVANGSAGVGSPASITNKIPPMQAFWVRVNTEGTGSIAVDNTMRFHKDVVGNILKAPKQNTQQVLRLQVSNGTNTDETVLYFNAKASDAFDQYDAQKRSNNEPSVPEIYTQVSNEQLVINGMNQIKFNVEIPIGFSNLTAVNNYSLSISANEMSNFENGTRIILIDKQIPNLENELTNGGTYYFNAPVTVPTTDRFSLVFKSPASITNLGNNVKLNAQVYMNTSNQIVVASPYKTNVAIYNVTGQIQYEKMLTKSNATISKSFSAGVYFVKLSQNGQSEIQKVIIR